MIPKDDRLTKLERRRINAQGVIQGVGFGPFVYGLANKFGLSGFVLNDECGVTIEIEGSSLCVDPFICALTQRVPMTARADSLASDMLPWRADKFFAVVTSQVAEAYKTRNPNSFLTRTEISQPHGG